MPDYSIFFRRTIDVQRLRLELPRHDVFISAFNSSDRVQTVFKEANSDHKVWLVHPEYQYKPLELPASDTLVCPAATDEVMQVNALLDAVGNLAGRSLCVDITGFMRHVLLHLVAKLSYLGITEFTAVYSEPISYKQQENTPFTTTTTDIVRPIRGMAGSPNTQDREALIIAVGYDFRLISQVAATRDGASVFPVFGFPSLSPDMYQQSVISSSKSGDITEKDDWSVNRRFAPANDPFTTAEVVSDTVSAIRKIDSQTNVYLCPLSTKVQSLGFALYWILEGRERGAVSILMPECRTYSRETTTGLKRLWCYTVELPRLAI